MTLSDEIKALVSTLEMQLNGFAKAAYEKDLRIADLERQLAAPSAPAVEQQSKINAELLLVARYALEYIDGIPKDIEVDASGFDRDWANSVVGRAKLVSPQAADTDKVREALDRSLISILIDASQDGNTYPKSDYMRWCKQAADALSAMAAQALVREVPEAWVPIEDHLPTDDCRVLAATWFDMTQVQQVEDVSFRAGSGTFSDCNVTHWMPLPAAPVQQEGE